MFVGRSKGTQAGPTQVARSQPAQAETAASRSQSLSQELHCASPLSLAGQRIHSGTHPWPIPALHMYACRWLASNRRAGPLYILQEVRDCRRVVGNGLFARRYLAGRRARTPTDGDMPRHPPVKNARVECDSFRVVPPRVFRGELRIVRVVDLSTKHPRVHDFAVTRHK